MEEQQLWRIGMRWSACVCVVITSKCFTPIPGLSSHGTVHSFIRGFGGVCSYGRRGWQHCCGHLTVVTCRWWESWWMCTKWICFRRTRYVLLYLMFLSQCTYFIIKHGLHAQARSNTYNIAHTDITCCRYCMFYIMYTGYETGHTHPQTHNQ